MLRTRPFPAALLAVLVSCAPSQSIPDPIPAAAPSANTTPTPAEPAEVQRPTGPLDRAGAEAYALQLINRDRASQGLEPVAWDATATRAGQRHADDMVRNGFTAHWGSDGSVPEQRYTEAGGMHMVQENAGCFADGKSRELDPDPTFDAHMIEKVQSAFFDEVPPNDGHRRNILKAWHTHVGVGLAKAKGSPIVCMTQEFIDVYGDYESLPASSKVGQSVRIAGKVNDPAKFIGVGLARIDMPKPRDSADLLGTSTYPIPAPYATFFPKGYKTPKPVDVNGPRFSIDLPLSDAGKRGLYQVSVWGEVPGNKDFVMLSLRTIRVE